MQRARNFARTTLLAHLDGWLEALGSGTVTGREDAAAWSGKLAAGIDLLRRIPGADGTELVDAFVAIRAACTSFQREHPDVDVILARCAPVDAAHQMAGCFDQDLAAVRSLVEGPLRWPAETKLLPGLATGLERLGAAGVGRVTQNIESDLKRLAQTLDLLAGQSAHDRTDRWADVTLQYVDQLHPVFSSLESLGLDPDVTDGIDEVHRQKDQVMIKAARVAAESHADRLALLAEEAASESLDGSEELATLSASTARVKGYAAAMSKLRDTETLSEAVEAALLHRVSVECSGLEVRLLEATPQVLGGRLPQEFRDRATQCLHRAADAFGDYGFRLDDLVRDAFGDRLDLSRAEKRQLDRLSSQMFGPDEEAPVPASTTAIGQSDEPPLEVAANDRSAPGRRRAKPAVRRSLQPGPAQSSPTDVRLARTRLDEALADRSDVRSDTLRVANAWIAKARVVVETRSDRPADTESGAHQLNQAMQVMAGGVALLANRRRVLRDAVERFARSEPDSSARASRLRDAHARTDVVGRDLESLVAAEVEMAARVETLRLCLKVNMFEAEPTSVRYDELCRIADEADARVALNVLPRSCKRKPLPKTTRNGFLKHEPDYLDVHPIEVRVKDDLAVPRRKPRQVGYHSHFRSDAPGAKPFWGGFRSELEESLAEGSIRASRHVPPIELERVTADVVRRSKAG